VRFSAARTTYTGSIVRVQVVGCAGDVGFTAGYHCEQPARNGLMVPRRIPAGSGRCMRFGSTGLGSMRHDHRSPGPVCRFEPIFRLLFKSDPSTRIVSEGQWGQECRRKQSDLAPDGHWLLQHRRRRCRDGIRRQPSYGYRHTHCGAGPPPSTR